MPTEPVSPNPVASPWAATAFEYSAAVRPVSAHAVRPSTSISSARISRRSRTIPPSVMLWPGGAVAAAPDGQLETRLAGERDDASDVVRAGDADDDARAGGRSPPDKTVRASS